MVENYESLNSHKNVYTAALYITAKMLGQPQLHQLVNGHKNVVGKCNSNAVTYMDECYSVLKLDADWRHSGM